VRSKVERNGGVHLLWDGEEWIGISEGEGWVVDRVLAVRGIDEGSVDEIGVEIVRGQHGGDVEWGVERGFKRTVVPRTM